MSSPSALPLPDRKIPGNLGLPFLGPILDRFSYYYNQGELEFLKSRIKKYDSTIFRCNLPPGPFMASNSQVVCLLDAISFQTLFDTSKVDKKNALCGTFTPSTAFTGGYSTCAYLDPSDPKHALLKRFFLSLLAGKHDKFIPLFRHEMSSMFSGMEDECASRGSAYFNDFSDRMSFEFVFRLLLDKSPAVTPIGKNGQKLVDIWLLFQLAPLMSLGLKYLPNVLEDLLLHAFPLPFFPVKSSYNKLYEAFHDSGSSLLDAAEEMGIKRDEACHNLVFLAGFNAYGGMKTLFPGLIKWVGTSGEDLHRRLRDEIRAAVKEEGGVTFAALDKMSLTKSVVYEALRMEPPVPYQYGRAKQDITIQNHDWSFSVKKGEMLFGYQPIATKDPKIFEKGEEFVADRFVGGGEELIKYVYWSNGRESDAPAAENKQCAGKEMVILACRLMVVDLFLRYDSVEVEIGKITLGSAVTIKSYTKSTNAN